MEKQLLIRATKCTLVLTESELMRCLAKEPDIFKKAIGRGKAHIRAERVKQFEKVSKRHVL